jgi:hypothetical protein
MPDSNHTTVKLLRFTRMSHYRHDHDGWIMTHKPMTIVYQIISIVDTATRGPAEGVLSLLHPRDPERSRPRFAMFMIMQDRVTLPTSTETVTSLRIHKTIGVVYTMAEKQISLGDLNSGQLQEVKRQLEEVRIRFYSILRQGWPFKTKTHALRHLFLHTTSSTLDRRLNTCRRLSVRFDRHRPSTDHVRTMSRR